MLDLLTGDAQAFLTKTWASRVHVHHTEPAALTGLLGLADVDRLLTSSAIRTPAVRVARDGAVLPESGYTRGGSLAGRPLTGLVDPAKLLGLLDDGATVVLQGLQRYWPPLADLVAQLELELGHPCQANAYLTPPGAQGFAVHSDSHDVFVFQTHGTKLWEIDGAELLLEPGVVAYLPTGTPHAARAQESMSLHVTLGINQLTWRALVERAVAEAVDQVPDTHLPAGYLQDPSVLAEGLAPHLAAVADAVRAEAPGAVAERQVRRFLTGRPSRLAGSLVDRVGLAALDRGTPLERRPGVPCVLEDAEDRLRVLLGDRVLVVPARLRPALEEVARRDTLVPGDLEGVLDLPSAVVLCRRLVREGLLRIA
ncbi:cupin domain-containing protein [Nocardioides houyundeii]|uniref:cupin domain-containing protein n=1 Tax=Nocardioides houyundeii TaxID=2045452 RepID=UPI000C78E587|nr:cupin domain-containing protein [Nocardioides houyundeii]